MDVKIEQTWKEALRDEFDKPYFASLVRFLHEQKAAGKVIYPPGRQIFKAFELTPLPAVKVVILGQDPYHGPGQAMGLCFSVPEGVPAPPSLKNIFKEIHDDLGVPMSGRPDLEPWARQGVLLLNSVLTVQAGTPASHSRIGWQEFTDAVIRTVSDRWEEIAGGVAARHTTPLSFSNKTLFIEVEHPAYLASVRTKAVQAAILARIAEFIGADKCTTLVFTPAGRRRPA